MKRVSVDRFEGIYTICIDKDKNFFAIETSEMPSGVREGSIIDITDDGRLLLNEEATNETRHRLHEKQKRLFNK